MSTVRMRPRFTVFSEKPPHIILENLATFLLEKKSPLIASYADHHVVLKFPPQYRHTWSPQLSLTVDPHQGGSQIRGLIGPSPNVWTKFIFIFGGLGVVTLFALMWGLAQWSLHQPPHALWALPFTIGGFIMAYLSSKAGQRLAHDEMLILKDFIDAALAK